MFLGSFQAKLTYLLHVSDRCILRYEATHFVWLPLATNSSLLLKNLIDVYANVLPTGQVS